MPRSSFEKSAETRSNILDTAHRLFVERGYSATSVREIGKKAGVTVGAIYNHFPTKEDIWKEVILTRHPYHEIFPILLGAEGETVAEVVRSAARLLLRELLNRTDLFNLMFIEIVEFRARHTAELIQSFLPGLLRLQSIIHQKPGRLRNISALVLIRSFLGLFFSFYITGIFVSQLPGMAADEDSLDRFVDLYLYGILDEDPSTSQEQP